MATSRVETMFHESFALSRPSMSKVLTIAEKRMAGGPNDISISQMLRQETNLGTNYVKAMPRYAAAAGLVGLKKYDLTKFGAFALRYDPFLEQASTQWLMHYHLSASHGPGPLFWHKLVSARFRLGSEFTPDDVASHIASLFANAEGKPLAERSARSTATVFMGTYAKPEALGHLGFLQRSAGGRYQVGEPPPPPTWAFGCALLDYWKSQFGDRLGVGLDVLEADDALGGLFLIGPRKINAILQELASAGYVEVYRVAPPYQVVLVRRDEEALLTRMYGAD